MRIGACLLGGRRFAVAVLDEDSYYDLGRVLGVDATGDDPLGALIRGGDVHAWVRAGMPLGGRDVERARLPHVGEMAWQLPFRPGKIIAVGRNYAEHARELGNAVPESPVIFEKLPDTCIGPNEVIRLDAAEGRVDFEGEIALMIGMDTAGLAPERMSEAILGITLLNDVTARAMQQRAKDSGLPWFEAKNRDTFCPLGPVVRLYPEFPAPFDVPIATRVNGETRQEGRTRDFIFDAPFLVAHIARRIALAPGDVIATGTPAGVGELHDGDVVEVECPEVGTLRNPVREI